MRAKEPALIQLKTGKWLAARAVKALKKAPPPPFVTKFADRVEDGTAGPNKHQLALFSSKVRRVPQQII